MAAKVGTSSDPPALIQLLIPPTLERHYSRETAYYQSDIYTNIAAGYYPLVVWQFWGRAARRPELKSLGRFFIWL
jgi:hypothetical protein